MKVKELKDYMERCNIYIKRAIPRVLKNHKIKEIDENSYLKFSGKIFNDGILDIEVEIIKNAKPKRAKRSTNRSR